MKWPRSTEKRSAFQEGSFLRTTSNGMALAFVAMNQVFGDYFQAHAEELTDIGAISELTKRDQFIFDVQTHHVATGKTEPLGLQRKNGMAISMMN